MPGRRIHGIEMKSLPPIHPQPAKSRTAAPDHATDVCERRKGAKEREAARGSRTTDLSAVDRYRECLADLSHPRAAQRADPFDQHRS